MLVKTRLTKEFVIKRPNGRGIDGSLMDLEYQRIELIKFNLFDNYTYETYIRGIGGKPGATQKHWPEMIRQNCGSQEAIYRCSPSVCQIARWSRSGWAKR